MPMCMDSWLLYKWNIQIITSSQQDKFVATRGAYDPFLSSSRSLRFLSWDHFQRISFWLQWDFSLEAHLLHVDVCLLNLFHPVGECVMVIIGHLSLCFWCEAINCWANLVSSDCTCLRSFEQPGRILTQCLCWCLVGGYGSLVGLGFFPFHDEYLDLKF